MLTPIPPSDSCSASQSINQPGQSDFFQDDMALIPTEAFLFVDGDEAPDVCSSLDNSISSGDLLSFLNQAIDLCKDFDSHPSHRGATSFTHPRNNDDPNPRPAKKTKKQ